MYCQEDKTNDKVFIIFTDDKVFTIFDKTNYNQL